MYRNNNSSGIFPMFVLLVALLVAGGYITSELVKAKQELKAQNQQLKLLQEANTRLEEQNQNLIFENNDLLPLKDINSGLQEQLVEKDQIIINLRTEVERLRSSLIMVLSMNKSLTDTVKKLESQESTTNKPQNTASIKKADIFSFEPLTSQSTILQIGVISFILSVIGALGFLKWLFRSSGLINRRWQ